jgi:hypothetical protein
MAKGRFEKAAEAAVAAKAARQGQPAAPRNAAPLGSVKREQEAR